MQKDDPTQITVTRRELLGMAALSGLAVLPGAAPLLAKPRSDLFAYVGTYSPAVRPGIFAYRMNAETGALTPAGSVSGIDNPSFLALDSRRARLYAVNEVGAASVSAFAIDRRTGALSPLGSQRLRGSGPAHLSLDAAGRHLLVANYGSGSVEMLGIRDDGRPGPLTDFVQHLGKGPNPSRQEGPHAHCIVPDPADRFALSCDLGLDRVLVYRLDRKNGKLIPNDPPSASVKPGAGPRHLAFGANGRRVYVVNELDSTITAFDYDPSKGTLHPCQTVSTLPDGFSGPNSGADIHVSPFGRSLYSSNRGHDSIAIFRIAPSTGELTPAGHTPTGGRTPRNFALDPQGHFLLAANQDSDNIVVFRIDAGAGKLTPTDHRIEVPRPACVKFLNH